MGIKTLFKKLSLEKFRNYVDTHKVQLFIFLILFIASIKIYEYETARRIAQDLNPSPGSEVILPFVVMLVCFIWNGFWEGIKEFKENDWYI